MAVVVRHTTSLNAFLRRSSSSHSGREGASGTQRRLPHARHEWAPGAEVRGCRGDPRPQGCTSMRHTRGKPAGHVANRAAARLRGRMCPFLEAQQRVDACEGVVGDKLMHHLAETFEAAVRMNDPPTAAAVGHMVEVLRRMAKAGRGSGGALRHRVFRAVGKAAARAVEDLPPRSMALLLHACAKSGEKVPEAFNTVQAALCRGEGALFQRFNAQDISNTLWAYAVMRPPTSGEVFSCAARHLIALWAARTAPPRRGYAQALANTAWAYATHASGRLATPRCREAARGVLVALAEYLTTPPTDTAMRGAKPQELANLVWAYATVRVAVDVAAVRTLFADMAAVVARRLQRDGFAPQAVANTLWACAVVQHSDAGFYETCAACLVDRLDGYAPRYLSNVAWAFASVACGYSALFERLARAVVAKAKAFLPQQFANTVWAYATLTSMTEAAQDMFRRFKEEHAAPGHMAGYLPQHVASIAWAYAKTDQGSAALYDWLARGAMKSLDGFGHRELSGLLWASAKNGHCSDGMHELYHAVATRRMEAMRAFPFRALANIVWAYATAEHTAPHLFTGLADVVAREMRRGRCMPQHLSNTVWAYATARRSDAVVFDAAAVAIAAQGEELTPQGVANTVWAYATARRSSAGSEELLRSLKHRVLSGDALAGFTPQHLANFIWGCASLQHDDAAVYNAVETAVLLETAQHGTARFRPQHVSNIVWAYATVRRAAGGLLEEMSNDAVTALICRHGGAQDIAILAWAFAKLEHQAAPWFTAMAPAAGESLKRPDATAQNIANVVWGYATARHAPPQLFDEVAAIALLHLARFSQQNLANTVWAYARVAHTAPALFDAVARTASARAGDFTPEQVASMVWAYTTVSHEERDFWKMV